MQKGWLLVWLMSGLLLIGERSAVALPNLTVSTSMEANSLPLDGMGSSQQERIVRVADFSITDAGNNGYTLTINASNSLVKADGSTPIPFQAVTVALGAPPPSSSEFTTPVNQPYVFSSTLTQENRTLYIRYTPTYLQDPGNYSALLSVSVVDR